MTRVLSPLGDGTRLDRARRGRRRGFLRYSRITGHCLALSILLVICQPLLAQSKPSFPFSAAEDSLESQPVASDSTASSAKSAPIAAPSAAFGATRVVLALAGVIGLIFLLRAGARRIFPARRGHPRHLRGEGPGPL